MKKDSDKSKDSLKDWLKGDDLGLVSWLSTDGAKPSDSPLSDDSFELKKKNMQLEDEISMLQRKLDEARKGKASPVQDISEIISNRPSVRSHIDRYQSRLDALNDKLRDLADQFPEDGRTFIRISDELASWSRELKGILDLMVSQPDRMEEWTSKLTAKSGELDEAYTDISSRIEDIYGIIQRKKLESQLAEIPPEGMEQGIAVDSKEMILLQKENERLRILVKERDEDLTKIRSLLKYKEEELIRREEDLLYRERMMEESKKKFDNERKSLEGLDAVALEKRLEHLRGEIQHKEEEMRQKEKYLASKMEELRKLELGMIEEEIDLRDEERKKEISLNKVHTGNQRFNDLLLGGYPFGSNIILHGPAFVGKEVLLNEFMAEGLKKGVPILWVITDKTSGEIRKNMEYVISGYEEYEKLGLVRYVDSYSRTIDADDVDEYTVYIDEPGNHAELAKAVDVITAEFLEKYEYYRLGFQSLSTFIAYSDSASAFRFLTPFVGKRRKSKAVCLYLLEKGMHSEQEIQMLGMLMDGVIEFSLDQMRTFLNVTGVTDVQTRGTVRYNWSNHGLSIGSFTLDHIK